MWTKFLLILTLLTGVIAPNTPKWGQKGHEPKYSCFFWVKLRLVNTQKLKLGIPKV